MYNVVNIKFSPRKWKNEFSRKEREQIEQFDRFFHENRNIGSRKKGEHAYQLKIVEENTKADKTLEFLKTLKEDTSFFVNVRTKYEDQDFRNADAYFLRFERKYEYYDDWNEEPYNSFQIVCADFTTSDENGCRTWDHVGSKLYAKGNSILKKTFREAAGATNYELSENSIISDTLYAYLVEHNIEKDFFRPVFQKNGERWAYMLDGRSSVLTGKSVRRSFFNRFYVCPRCGRTVWALDESLIDEFADNFGEQVIIGHPYIFDRWTIDEENINLKPVNQTHDYFRSNRMTIVNKELFHLIEAKIPGIRKKSIPIFKQNQDDIQE